jgi:hypothetical protein
MPQMDAVKIRRPRLQDSGALARIQAGSYRTYYASAFPRSYLDHCANGEQEHD